MKKSIFTILLAFLMLFNVYGQDTIRLDSNNNGILNVNSQVDVSIDDQRDVKYIDVFTKVINENLLTNTLLKETLVETNNQLVEILQIRKKERSMSAIDYLIQKTNLDEQEINNILSDYYKANRNSYILLMLFLCLLS